VVQPDREGVVEGKSTLVADPSAKPGTMWRITRQARRVFAGPSATKGNLTDHAVELAMLTPDADRVVTIAIFPLQIAHAIGDGISAMAEEGLVPDGQS